MDAVNFSLSVCNISFFGENLEHEIFQVKVGTLKMNPILEDIQICHKTRTTHANYLFEGVNHIVFMSLTDEKKNHNLTLSIFLELWSNLSTFLGTATIYGPVFGPLRVNHGPKFHVSEHFSHCFKVFHPRNTS